MTVYGQLLEDGYSSGTGVQKWFSQTKLFQIHTIDCTCFRVTNKYIMFFNNQKDFLNNLSKGLLLGDPE